MTTQISAKCAEISPVVRSSDAARVVSTSSPLITGSDGLVVCSRCQRRNNPYTVCHGPYVGGMSRQGCRRGSATGSRRSSTVSTTAAVGRLSCRQVVVVSASPIGHRSNPHGRTPLRCSRGLRCSVGSWSINQLPQTSPHQQLLHPDNGFRSPPHGLMKHGRVGGIQPGRAAGCDSLGRGCEEARI